MKNKKEKIMSQFPYPYLLEALNRVNPDKASLLRLVWSVRVESARLLTLINTSHVVHCTTDRLFVME